MKKLYLIRHSKSSWDNPQLSDYDRPLNDRGKKDRYKVADYLKDEGIYPNLVLCSPSKRTKSSLKAYKEILGISCDVIYDEKLYETTYQDLLDIIYSINDDYDTVFLIAHNPSLNNLVDFLLRGFNENIPTSGVVGLEFGCNSWKDISDTNCSLTLFTYPKLINN